MENITYKVKNRSSGMTVYRIPERNVRREFQPGEVKSISYQELMDLSYQPGGREIMTHFLQIQAPEITKELNIHTEPEYNMSEKDIVGLITNGTLDEFLDCLDFAPVGVIDILKELSVRLPLNDSAKRKALREKTGFDIDKAIENLDKPEEEKEVAERRAKPVEEKSSGAPARRTGGYKVINKTAEN